MSENTVKAITLPQTTPGDTDPGRQRDAEQDVRRRHQDGSDHLEPHDLSSVEKHGHSSPDRAERGPYADRKDESERRLD